MPTYVTVKDIVQVAAFDSIYKNLPDTLSYEDRFVTAILLTSDESFATAVRDNPLRLKKYLKKAGLFDTNLKTTLDKLTII